ncbi:MAG: M55 family metallopeptidase, partial [Planctomycetes bacterium]|nr:M55 family metallopeptidase [Planctomycetota bacterium]
MTADINAAITGALREAPEAEFVVCDGHGVMRNILIEELHEAAQLVVGPASPENKPLCQAQGCDETCDLAFFTGYHSRAGTPNGLLSHTWVGSTICNVRINGEPAGETALNGAIVGHWDVPVGLVSGAHELGPEVAASLPAGTVFVSTKQTYGATAALCLPPAKTRKLLEDGASEAVRRFKAGKLAPLKPRLPVRMEAEMYRREMADKACRAPGLERLDERTVAVTEATTIAAASRMWTAICRAQDEEPAWLK